MRDKKNKRYKASKKMGCPAQIVLKKIIVYPDFRVSTNNLIILSDVVIRICN